MSDFLFQNVSNVFHAPIEVIEIIQQFTAVQEPKNNVNITPQTEDELSLDENGKVSLTDDYVIGKSSEVFGDKIFGDVPEKLKSVIDDIQVAKDDNETEPLDYLKSIFHNEAVGAVMETAQYGYGADLRSSDKKRLEKKLKADSDHIINKAYGDLSITNKKLEKEHDEILSLCSTDEEVEAANQEFEEKRKAAVEEVVRTVETQKKEQQKKGIEDSVKEFLRLRVKLANYFEENHLENIFDYIPPQKTDQIFTPKWVAKKMIDMLEQENPGCFDMPDKTFIDLYMKSGLYIAEIVKRLYQIDKMKREYPDGTERLRHIFREQVYGLAPTEIIYKIATNFILGFEDIVTITEHNFRQADALEYAKQGTLEQFLDELYGGDNNG